MNITEWALLNEMSPDEFKNEIVDTMAAIGTMEMDASDYFSDMVVWTVEYQGKPVQVIVRKT
jgi:hypothetical protein